MIIQILTHTINKIKNKQTRNNKTKKKLSFEKLKKVVAFIIEAAVHKEGIVDDFYVVSSFSKYSSIEYDIFILKIIFI